MKILLAALLIVVTSNLISCDPTGKARTVKCHLVNKNIDVLADLTEDEFNMFDEKDTLMLRLVDVSTAVWHVNGNTYGNDTTVTEMIAGSDYKVSYAKAILKQKLQTTVKK